MCLIFCHQRKLKWKFPTEMINKRFTYHRWIITQIRISIGSPFVHHRIDRDGITIFLANFESVRCNLGERKNGVVCIFVLFFGISIVVEATQERVRLKLSNKNLEVETKMCTQNHRCRRIEKKQSKAKWTRTLAGLAIFLLFFLLHKTINGTA